MIQATIIRAAILLCLAGSSGLAAGRKPSDAQRAETLRRVDVQILKKLEADVRRKSAIVLTGQSVRPIATNSDTINVAIIGPPNSHVGAAMAVAIDKHGYFLTAAHVADDEPMSLVFYDGARLRALPAHVAARSPRPKKRSADDLDVAVLHVDAELGEVFRWALAPSIRKSDPIFGIGRAGVRVQSEKTGIIAVTAFAGTFHEAVPLRNGGFALRMKMPTRPGDSGGPVVTLKGELLGVESCTVYPFLRRSYEVADRPDLKWLSNVIESDWESRTLSVDEGATSNNGDVLTVTVPLLR